MRIKDYLRRAGLALVFAAGLAAVLCACASEPVKAPVEPDEIEEQWPSNYAGGTPEENINAKEISISGELADGGYEVNIKFVHGSLMAGVDEAAASSVPAYKAYALSSPERLVVEFESLNYWDYERLLEVSGDDPLLFGIFRVNELESGKLGVYFQLKRHCVFNVTEKDDTLKIVLEPQEDGASEGTFFVTANALSDFRESRLIGSGLAPTLSSNAADVMLISQPFMTREEAKAKLDELMGTPMALILEGRTDIIELAKGALPEYNAALDYSELLKLRPTRVNGAPQSLPVLMPDGLYLCSSADGRLNLLSKALSEELDEETLLDIQELWTVDDTGRTKRLTDFEFAAIEQAAFSPEGRRLAILEHTEDSSFLYIYDMETNELLYNLGEEGFGSMTSNFVWDTMGTAIYAVSGTEQLQLLKYDFTIPDETKRVSRVDETPVGEGDLGFFDGDLYFSDVSADGESIVYKIKPEGGARTEYARGSSFKISPDNRYMAILSSTEIGGDETETTDNATLTLKNVVTGEETVVVQNKFVVDFAWSHDGKLYFSASENIETSDDLYPFKLMNLAPGEEAQEVCDLIAPAFFLAPDREALYLPVQQQWQGVDIRATFIMDLS